MHLTVASHEILPGQKLYAVQLLTDLCRHTVPYFVETMRRVNNGEFETHQQAFTDQVAAKEINIAEVPAIRMLKFHDYESNIYIIPQRLHLRRNNFGTQINA